MMKAHRLLLAFLSIVVCSLSMHAQTPEKPNIVFIILDDMNDFTGTLGGQPQIKTPVMDSLFGLGTNFMNAYCNAPVCGPSRTSMLSGKDMKYTQVYDNNEYLDEFRDNFTNELGNEEVITIPEYLKNSGQYYTCGINKIFHDPFNKDYDVDTEDPCLKTLSWSKVISFSNWDSTTDKLEATNVGVDGYLWGVVDSAVEYELKDYRAVDSAIEFINDVASGEIALCDSVFFLALGFAMPHLDLYVPEGYFPADYLNDIYEEPFNYPYNFPENTYPFNGIVMPPQPDPKWNDYYALGPLGHAISIGQKDVETSFSDYVDSLPMLPVIEPDLTDEDRKEILMEAKRANAIMAYMAGVQFVDAQIGRLMDSIQLYPEIYNNTVFIIVGDNGFSFGEKHHWLKRSLWETDIRVPFAIFGPSFPQHQVSYNAVSLLDLFPTICDIAGLPYPSFANGEPYLDGKSIFPILNNASIAFAHPALISFEAENNKECSCFPQIAVRDDRFAYIRYQSDGGDPVHDCILDSSVVEEELYEVGVHRETDPNEWNNLIDNPDYAPVVNYLQQFLPDSSLYLETTYKAVITNNSLACLLEHNDTLFLAFDWYDENGIAIAPDPGYVYKWTNNLTDDILIGTSVNFMCNWISDDDFNAGNRLMIYLQVYDTSGALIAFDTKYFYVNPDFAPTCSFEMFGDGELTVSFTDLEITGNYTCYWWEINGDSMFYNSMPGPFTFEASGAYAITLHVQYGNTPCIKSFTRTFISDEIQTNNIDNFLVYPNPANTILRIEFPNGAYDGHLELSDINGKIVRSVELNADSILYYDIDVANLASGLYVLHFYGNATEFGTPVVIMHNK
ncbi:MAG TPA: sulfatase-like hydrolase/transferase [Chitinophagales bacterium]|nr:sulfatase-like hydrolase/transferase [Chitinophagales bacterium]